MTLSLDSGRWKNLGDRRAPRPVTHTILFFFCSLLLRYVALAGYFANLFNLSL